MKPLLALLFVISAVLLEVSAGSGGRDTEVCGTIWGPRRTVVGRKTVTSTKIVKSIKTFKSTKLRTSTLPAITSTSTLTVVQTSSTTLSTPVSLISTTQTDSSTLVITQAATQTVTNVITEVVSGISTSTVATLPGFVPVADTLEDRGTGPIVFDKRLERRRAGSLPQDKFEDIGQSKSVCYNGQGPMPGYPQQVKCTVFMTSTQVFTTTSVLTSIITTSPAKVTAVATTTSRSVVTVNPNPASSTVTIRTTVVRSSTALTTDVVTVTSTTTSTSYTATATVNPACAENNVLGAINGGAIVSTAYGATLFQVSSETFQGIATAYDCCILATANPLTWHYFWLGPQGGNQCFVISGEYCPVPHQPGGLRSDVPDTYANVNYDSSQPAGSGFFVGNGACGGITAAYDVTDRA